MLGVKAVAAVASFFPVLFLFIAFVIGLGAGASVLIGQAWGAQQTERVKAVVGTTLTAGLLLGLLIAVVGSILAEPLLRMLGTPPDVLNDAIGYARTMMWAVPGLFLFLLMTSMLRGVGDTLSPLLALLLSTAVGLLVTPALIRGWFGLPQMGVVSAAWGTIIAYVVAMAWLIWRLLRQPYRGRPHPMAPDAAFTKHLRLDGTLLKTVLRIGVPMGVQMVVLALAEIALLTLVNGYGSQATAAYGAVNQIINYVQFPAVSIGITCSILSAQAIGAGQLQRLGGITRAGLQVNLVMTGGLVLLGYGFSRPIISAFVADAAVVELAQGLLHVMLWSLVVLGMAAALGGTMRASGAVLVPTAINVGCILLVEIPVAWVLSQSMGLTGIWLSYPATFAVMLALQAAYYHLVWKKKPIQRLI